jgi:hypothetical protein
MEWVATPLRKPVPLPAIRAEAGCSSNHFAYQRLARHARLGTQLVYVNAEALHVGAVATVATWTRRAANARWPRQHRGTGARNDQPTLWGKRMSESAQKKLLRVRPPRVRITYDVHTNGAIEKRELPFIVGIFADLSGDRDPEATAPVPVEMKERRIVDIDRDNFNEVLRQSVPRVVL